jgi:hypothetical protein
LRTAPSRAEALEDRDRGIERGGDDKRPRALPELLDTFAALVDQVVTERVVARVRIGIEADDGETGTLRTRSDRAADEAEPGNPDRIGRIQWWRSMRSGRSTRAPSR